MIVYYNESILSYIASIRSYFGLDTAYEPNQKFSELIEKQKPEKIYLLLIDAMGANLLNRKLSENSFLRKNMLYVTDTVFPSTTTAATTSIRNGHSPNENAWLGWCQYLKEVDDIIIPFKDKNFYDDKTYEPEIFNHYVPVESTEEELEKKGIAATSIYPAFKPNGAKSFKELCKRLLDYSNNSDYRYIYAYWDLYDSLMHKFGPDSFICNLYLKYLDHTLNKMMKNLSKDTMLVVLADHGQIKINRFYNLNGSKYEKYLLRKPALEVRAMAFYIKEEYLSEFEREFKNDFEDDYILLSKNQVMKTKLFGSNKNHERFIEFIGGYLAIAKSDLAIIYETKKGSRFVGQHAGICEDELKIPVIVYHN